MVPLISPRKAVLTRMAGKVLMGPSGADADGTYYRNQTEYDYHNPHGRDAPAHGEHHSIGGNQHHCEDENELKWGHRAGRRTRGVGFFFQFLGGSDSSVHRALIFAASAPCIVTLTATTLMPSL